MTEFKSDRVLAKATRGKNRRIASGALRREGLKAPLAGETACPTCVDRECGIEGDYTRSVIRSSIAALLFASVACAQYEVPRKAQEYPAHASWPAFDIGAESMGHSIPVENGTLFARDYLAIEVAIYPHNHALTNISSRYFMLRINGKTPLEPESAGFVASSIKYPSWQNHPRGEVIAGPVVIGPTPDQGHFPGDPTAPAPTPAPMPHPDDPNVPPAQEKAVEQQVAEAALPEIDTHVPVKGVLYFFYSGKLKKIHALELEYDDGHGVRETLKVQ